MEKFNFSSKNDVKVLIIYLYYFLLSCAHDFQDKTESQNISVDNAKQFHLSTHEEIKFLASSKQTKSNNNQTLTPLWDEALSFDTEDNINIEVPLRCSDYTVATDQTGKEYTVENRLIIRYNKKLLNYSQFIITKIYSKTAENTNTLSFNDLSTDSYTFIYTLDGILITRYETFNSKIYPIAMNNKNCKTTLSISNESYLIDIYEKRVSTKIFHGYNQMGICKKCNMGGIYNYFCENCKSAKYLSEYDRTVFLKNLMNLILEIIGADAAKFDDYNIYYELVGHKFNELVRPYTNNYSFAASEALDELRLRSNSFTSRSYIPTHIYDSYLEYQYTISGVEYYYSGFGDASSAIHAKANSIAYDLDAYVNYLKDKCPIIDKPEHGPGCTYCDNYGCTGQCQKKCNDSKCPYCGGCLDPSLSNCHFCMCVCACDNDHKCPICRKCFRDENTPTSITNTPHCNYCEGEQRALHLLQDSILRFCQRSARIFMVLEAPLNVKQFSKWENVELAANKIYTSPFGTRIFTAVPAKSYILNDGPGRLSGRNLRIPIAENKDKLAGIFLHELFHSHQTIRATALANAEVEAKLAKLIFTEEAGIKGGNANHDSPEFYKRLKELRSCIDSNGNNLTSKITEFYDKFKELALQINYTNNRYAFDADITGAGNTQTLKSFF